MLGTRGLEAGNLGIGRLGSWEAGKLGGGNGVWGSGNLGLGGWYCLERLLSQTKAWED